MQNFQASEKCEEKRTEYSIDAYDISRQSIRARVAVKYLDLDLNFFNKIWDPITMDVSAASTSNPGIAS